MDQRGPKKLAGVLSERASTLRAAGQRGFSKEELEARERVRLKIRGGN